jgi:membrane-associated PAP2 superfamily phosphatase
LWRRLARRPLQCFLIAASLFATTRIDVMLAEAAFFDASRNRWRGAESWWVNEFAHTGGRWAVRVVVAIAFALWIRRRRALKTITNVDCPWDLQSFGGVFLLCICSQRGRRACGRRTAFLRRTPVRATH